MTPLRILHLHSTFDLGGKEARAVRLMNAFGDRAVHSIATAMPEQTGACAQIAAGIDYRIAEDAPSLQGKPGIRRYRALARYMRQFDLLLSYNWGSMDAVMARRIFGGPPLIHHEDGFNADEAIRLNWKRNGFRRLALRCAHALVVPSQRLETIATDVWRQPATRVCRIANGIDTAAYAQSPQCDAIPGFQRRDGEVVIGTLAGLRAVKDLTRLVRAFAQLPRNCRLVIVGEGPERGAIMAAADQAGVADRVHLPGFVAEPRRYVGLFDIFALSSLSEQFPISVVEAMAAGLPVVSTDVGDVAAMVSAENRRFVTSDPMSFDPALQALVDDPATRKSVGEANRTRAIARFDEGVMIAAYADLYSTAAGLAGALR